ncbi:hypothetical protein [Piscinibacter sp.]|uniref:hypothetical protein n=1 Tax=Piscinibacter sp. TaxID=1903157 RepID=UPI002F3E1F1D
MTCFRWTPRAAAVGCALAALCAAAQAGRPLLVDDANVNEVGAGHVEAWHERMPGGATAWTVAPAYAPWKAVELSVAHARSASWQRDVRRLQAKIQLAEPRDGGCHPAIAFGAFEGDDPTTRFAIGIVTCDIASGALHLNIGGSRESGGTTVPTYGAAWEQPVGPLVGHVEWLGQRHAPATIAIGLRRDVVKHLQLDASVARNAGQTLFSVGFKSQF